MKVKKISADYINEKLKKMENKGPQKIDSKPSTNNKDHVENIKTLEIVSQDSSYENEQSQNVENKPIEINDIQKRMLEMGLPASFKSKINKL